VKQEIASPFFISLQFYFSLETHKFKTHNAQRFLLIPKYFYRVLRSGTN